jgi:type 1 glutamine amidotransferase
MSTASKVQEQRTEKLKEPFKVLVFSKTSGYRHDSIPAGISALCALADRTKAFTVDASENAETCMTHSTLNRYTVVILLQCTGDFLNPDQVIALQHFVDSGGGIVGIHGAAAAMLQNNFYGGMIGAHFDMHPEPEPGRVLVENADHWILSGSDERSDWMDEWYNFNTHPRDNKALIILLKGDTTTFKGGKMGDDHPLAWCQEISGGGRTFYTALGHFDEAYTDEWFMRQIYRAIMWTANCDKEADKDV